MTIYGIHEAKIRLSKLIDKAVAGEEVIIAKAGKAMVKLVPAGADRPRIRFGPLEGQLTIPKYFDASDPEIEAMFAGKA